MYGNHLESQPKWTGYRILFSFVLFSILTLPSLFSQRNINGKVISEDSPAGLPGVNVTIKNENTGTMTDFDGNYSVEVNSNNAILVFSYIGFKTKEIPVGDELEINVTLVEDVSSLDEVVVIGYGTQVRRDVTGSIASLNEDSFSAQANTNVDQMIQGKAAGVQVVQNSGEPGGGMSINIRGVGSINAGSGPLYVIDGLPINNEPSISQTGNETAPTRSPRNPIGFLNPEDIASIDILKDASATAIYGSRGANGVIMITTKKGNSGDLRIDYSTHVGFNKVHNRLNLLNAEQYREGINSLIDLGAGSEAERVPDGPGVDTDWQDVVFRDQAILQKHNVSFSWGNANTSYLATLNNTKEEGLVKNTQFNRFSGRFNLNHRTEKFNVGINTTISYIKDNFVPNGFDVNLRGGAINAAKLYDPTLPIRDSQGNFVISEFFDIDNPEAIIFGNHITGNRYRSLGSAFLEYFLLPEFSFKVNVGADVNNENKSVYKDRTTIIGNSLGGVASAYSATDSNYLIEGTVNYIKDFGVHDVSLLLGITTQQFQRRFSSQDANNFTTDATLADNFGLADRSTLINNSSKASNSLLSYLGRINYKLLDKYLLTASYRIDGSSRFGEGNRFGFFPSVSAGWLLDQEEFFKNDIVNTLKLRASWGLTGNQEIGNNQAISTFNTGNQTSYVLNDNFVTSLNPSRIANPNLQWETTEQIDLGIDFGFFNDRISGSFAWYNKKTTDMLLSLPVPTSSGFSSQLVNIGSMKNTGIEIGLNTYNISGKNFSWNSNLNLATLQNEVIDLGGIPEILSGSFGAAATEVGIIRPGDPLRSFYGFDVIGVWQEGDDFTQISNNVSPGDFKFRDVNGDGTIDGNDRVILGNSFPDLTWGFTNTFDLGNWNLNVLFMGVEGVEMINGNLLEQYYPRSGIRVNRFAEPFLNRWTPENPTNQQPSYLGISQQGQGVNSKTVVDASYVKLQSIRLGYMFPSDWIKNSFKSFEIYATGLNLATFSSYDGFDPALNPNGTANFRIDWNGYPSATSFLLGFNIGF
ncbi:MULTISPECIES: SusC/RagA family TonB-linked outer membrane protein [Maribacter]|uniref:TonB-dependent receptor n=2 Tax=Maribacter TaxID=252356 RepID=A0A5R8MC72_9FLAO|nr:MULTISPECIES: TonB-dependent receptor [Maribacter]KAA2219894.1 TonB-dependent receptor [Maribacter flavus]TLF47100.1 TonB-dependent receptor [Maribacter aurantiacus]